MCIDEINVPSTGPLVKTFASRRYLYSVAVSSPGIRLLAPLCRLFEAQSRSCYARCLRFTVRSPFLRKTRFQLMARLFLGEIGFSPGHFARFQSLTTSPLPRLRGAQPPSSPLYTLCCSGSMIFRHGFADQSPSTQEDRTAKNEIKASALQLFVIFRRLNMAPTKHLRYGILSRRGELQIP